MCGLTGSRSRAAMAAATAIGSIGSGAGLYLQGGKIVVVDCRFANNYARNTGGAVSTAFQSGVYLGSTTFINNESRVGGGAMYASVNENTSSGVFIDRCRFLGNQSGSSGGALSMGRGSILVASSLFSGNNARWSASTGGAIYMSGSQLPNTVLNCTLSRNSANAGGGIYVNAGTSRVWNTISYANSALRPARDLARSGSGTLDARYCCVQYPSPLPGTGNINSNPRFINARGPDSTPGTADDNLRIPHPFLASSPCVNRGRDAFVAGAQFGVDLDRRLRRQAYVAGGSIRVDMGAYEVRPITKLHAATGDDIQLVTFKNNILSNVANTDAVSFRRGDLLRFRARPPLTSLKGRFAWLALDAFVGGSPPLPFPIRAFRVGPGAAFFSIGPIPAPFGGNGILIPPGLSGARLMAQAYVFDTRAPNGVGFATDGRELRFR